MTDLSAVVRVIEAARLDLSSEKAAQAGIASALEKAGLSFVREHVLAQGDVIDLFGEGVGIEVKISGSARAIFRQIERYALHDAVKAIVLATNRAMRLPAEVAGKPAVVVSMGKGWL